jgi:hypothetical protein
LYRARLHEDARMTQRWAYVGDLGVGGTLDWGGDSAATFRQAVACPISALTRSGQSCGSRPMAPMKGARSKGESHGLALA